MIAYPDDFNAAVVELTCKKLDLWRRAVKEDRPASLWAICQSGNRHVSLHAVPKVSAITNLTPSCGIQMFPSCAFTEAIG